MKDTIIHIHHSARTIAASQHGSVLIYIVAVILIAGVLGLGIVSMTTTSAFTGLGYNPSDQARFLAKSGMNYAVEQAAAMAAAGSKSLILDEGEIQIIFEPADADNPNRYDITSTGTVFRGTSREASFQMVEKDVLITPGGVVIIVDEDGNRTEQEFSNTINTTDEDPDWVELIITSSVGTQEYDNFDFYAPEGITIEEGVEFISTTAQGSINLESDTGDIVIGEGVSFSTGSSANNETEEIYITTKGNIDIQGAELSAERYIYLDAGKNIYAQNADLTVSTSSNQLGINFVLTDYDDPDFDYPGDMEIENTYIKFLNRDHNPDADPCGSLVGTLQPGSDPFNCP